MNIFLFFIHNIPIEIMDYLKPDRFDTSDVKGKVTIYGLYIIIFISVLCIISTIFEINLIASIIEENGRNIDRREITGNDTRQFILFIVWSITYFGIGVGFISWTYSALKNLDCIRLSTKYTPAHAVFPWFVPMISFFYPRLVLGELWEQIHLHSEKTYPGKMLLNLWWGSFLLISITYCLRNLTAHEAITVEDLITSDFWHITHLIITIIAAIITVLMINIYTEKEDILFRKLRMERRKKEAEQTGY